MDIKEDVPEKNTFSFGNCPIDLTHSKRQCVPLAKFILTLFIFEAKTKIKKLPKLRAGGGAPCFRIGGAEDNFIFYIEYCLFFAPVKKLRWDYNILKQF